MGRLRGFDYKSPYFYMVTLKRLKGLAAFSEIGPNGLVENAITRAFTAAIRGFHLKWRCCEEISPFVIMPDHLHLLFKIRAIPDRVALGRLVYPLEKELAEAYWRVVGAGKPFPPRPIARLAQTVQVGAAHRVLLVAHRVLRVARPRHLAARAAKRPRSARSSTPPGTIGLSRKRASSPPFAATSAKTRRAPPCAARTPASFSRSRPSSSSAAAGSPTATARSWICLFSCPSRATVRPPKARPNGTPSSNRPRASAPEESVSRPS